MRAKLCPMTFVEQGFLDCTVWPAVVVMIYKIILNKRDAA